MRKLRCILVLCFIIFVCSCRIGNKSKPSREAKPAGKTGKQEIWADSNKPALQTKTQGNKTESNSTISAVLPAYFWDTKSIIW